MNNDLMKKMMQSKAQNQGKMGNMSKNSATLLNRRGGFPPSPGFGAAGATQKAANQNAAGQGEGSEQEQAQSQNPISNALNSTKQAATDAAVEQAKKKAKQMALKILIPAIPYILIGFLVVLLTTMLILLPSVLMEETVGKAVGWFDKVGNALHMDGFRSSSQMVTDKLDKASKNYEKNDCAIGKDCYEGSFDRGILLATFHTNNLIDPENYDVDAEDLGEESLVHEAAAEVINTAKLNYFYRAQEDMLGSPDFDSEAFKSERRMIYFLVDYKVGWTCTDSAWDSFMAKADTFADIVSHSSYKLSYLGQHSLTDFNLLWPKNKIYEFFSNMWDYKAGDVNYLSFATRSGLYSEDDLEKKHLFSKIFSAPTVTCGEGQHYMPYLVRYINYETYLNYVKDVYLPAQEFDCDNCPKYTTEEKNSITRTTLYEICDHRNALASSVEGVNGTLICSVDDDLKITAYLEGAEDGGSHISGLRGDLSSLILPSGSTGFNGVVHFYSQTDYKNYTYYGDKSISRSGCGPTSLSIAISSLSGVEHDPVELTNMTCNVKKLCTYDSGTYRSAMLKVPPEYGIKSVQVGKNTAGVQQLLDALSTGNAIVIAIMGPGHFTSGGHYITLTGVNDQGQVYVVDPNNGEKKGKNKWWDLNIIVNENNGAFWILTRE